MNQNGPNPQHSKAVFLDKDGTLIENVPYNVDPAHIRFTPGALAGAKALHDAGYQLVIITNQSGVARGYFEPQALERVHQHLRREMAAAGAPLAGFYFCPHHPRGTVERYAIHCDCRKPQPGLFQQAAADLGIDCSHSWYIGDILDDVQAGRRAGCRTVLLDAGPEAGQGETKWNLTRARLPHHLAYSLDEAARIINAVDLHTPEPLCAD